MHQADVRAGNGGSTYV